VCAAVVRHPAFVRANFRKEPTMMRLADSSDLGARSICSGDVVTRADVLKGSGVKTAVKPLPRPRGPISTRLFASLRQSPHSFSAPPIVSADAFLDEDLQLSLYCCYELHYQGFGDVNDEWEWEPSLIAFRGGLEESFERRLRAELPGCRDVAADQVPVALWDMSRGGGFSLSEWLLQNGTRFHAEEFAIHRSGYQLKEADPHTWGIPRLRGRSKAAMVKIQADEYGGGSPKEMHSHLFAEAMSALNLDPTYGAYLDRLPAVTLATTNLISLFGLHRRLRGALVGHLASFEMNSVGPMGRYSSWLESIGVPMEGRRFYDVHVEADEVHQQIAVDDLVGGLLEDEPDQAGAVMFGARAVALIESAFAAHLVSAWKSDRSSLRSP
jgi:Iron-containing redox enzyme